MASSKRSKAPESQASTKTMDARKLQMAQSAQRKISAGQSPSRDEQRALDAVRRHQRETIGPEYAHAVRKRDACDRTGISQKVWGEQSRRFGLTFHKSGNTLDLFAELAAWNAWASENKHAITRLLKSKELAETLGDDDTESLDYCQRELVMERTLKEREARQERSRQLLPRELFHEVLGEFFVQAHQKRLDQLSKREQPIQPDEIAGWYRQDLQAFAEAIDLLFNDEDDLPES